MRILAILVVVLGLALAGGAAYKARQFWGTGTATPVQAQFVRVLAAKEALNQGDRLSPGQLKWVDWPAGKVPKGAFTSTGSVFGRDNDQRRYVLRRIEPGELILPAKLSRPNEPGRISFELPAGMRAVSIRIDAVTGVAGFVAPGDHVDILLTHKSGALLVNQVVLQAIEVLAVDQTDDTETSSPRVGRTATVAVTTPQAQKLALAQQSGKLSLMLRPQGDAGKNAPGALDSTVLAGPAGPAPAPKRTIRVRRGISAEEVTIQ